MPSLYSFMNFFQRGIITAAKPKIKPEAGKISNIKIAVDKMKIVKHTDTTAVSAIIWRTQSCLVQL